MAQRDHSKVQLDFPALTADLISDLSLVGALGLLDFSDVVIPTFIIGSRNLTIQVENPEFISTEVFSGTAISPAAGVAVATTGPLPAGTYEFLANMGGTFQIAANGFYELQHRDAADAVTLAVLLSMGRAGTVLAGDVFLPPIRYVLAANERLRMVTSSAGAGEFYGNIFAALVPIP